MGGRSAFVYSPEYLGYKLSDEHPLNPIRLALTESLIDACGLLDGPDVFRAEPRTATDDEIMYAHDREYVDRVRDLGHAPRYANPALDFGLGTGDNPVFPNMHEASALVAGGSLVAAELVTSGQALHAFNPGGGLHHADRQRASGFCVYNDCAVAIAWLRMLGLRVLYTDTDAHHGDGAQNIFYEDPGVLTISFHETGRYLFPGTGFVDERGSGAGLGYAINVPLMPYTDHASFVECYDLVVPPLARAFKPDIIVAQNGCDGHAIDPLTHLHYSDADVRARGEAEPRAGPRAVRRQADRAGRRRVRPLDRGAASLGLGLGGDQRPAAARRGARVLARPVERSEPADAPDADAQRPGRDPPDRAPGRDQPGEPGRGHGSRDARPAGLLTHDQAALVRRRAAVSPLGARPSRPLRRPHRIALGSSDG